MKNNLLKKTIVTFAAAGMLLGSLAGSMTVSAEENGMVRSFQEKRCRSLLAARVRFLL